MSRANPLQRALTALLSGLSLALLLSLTLLPSPARADGWSSAALVARAEEAHAAEQPAEEALAWHRAALLDPAVVEAAPPLHPAVSAPLAPHLLAWGLYGGAAVGLLGIAGIVRAGRSRAWLGVAALGLGVATAAALPLAGLAEARDLAVVMEAVPLRPSPAEAAPARAELEPGDSVLIQSARGDFLEVASERGEGWVPREALTRVVPIDT